MNQKSIIYTLTTILVVLIICETTLFFSFLNRKEEVFTHGNIDVEVMWDSNIDNNIYNGKDIYTEPKISKVGESDAIVFAEVKIPYVTDNENTYELFKLYPNSNWTEIKESFKDENTKTINHIFAYSKNNEMINLSKNSTSESIINKMVLTLPDNYENLEISSTTVSVSGYGLQKVNSNNNELYPDKLWDTFITNK